MMSAKEFLGLLSIVFGTLAYGAYFISIFRGRTRPHMFSWIVWGTVSGVVYFAQLSKEAGPGAWATGASALVCYLVGVLAYFRGEKNITRSDWIFFIGAFAAIPLWYATKEPLWSVILVVVIDTMGFCPTMRKSYHRPHEELALLYGLDNVKFILSLLALKNFSVTATLYPLTALCLNSAFIAMLFYRRAALVRITK
jgi:hypothetical protein